MVDLFGDIILRLVVIKIILAMIINTTLMCNRGKAGKSNKEATEEQMYGRQSLVNASIAGKSTSGEPMKSTQAPSSQIASVQ
ncbi:unnamed protein product [Cylicocyclus nassatus]|uniref:Uncharacterized protein n=1 Tax=Cylicocyclus nassatus TaxID=53992 RepID=A0AA36M0F1_CYLNA|nr:unnamed protein product [Cylicocyclus nassatus]